MIRDDEETVRLSETRRFRYARTIEKLLQYQQYSNNRSKCGVGVMREGVLKILLTKDGTGGDGERCGAAETTIGGQQY